MFEHRTHRVISRGEYLLRLARHGAISLGVLLVALAIGVIGYHYFESLPWIDALLNASMILGGMGPVNPLTTTGGKLFASFYALFSGVVLIALMGILLAPVFHRLMHRFHMDR